MESLGRTPFIMHICRHDIHELNLKHYDLTLICRQTAKTSLLSGYRSFVPPPRYCRKSACRFSILCVLVLYKRLLTAARNKNRSMMTIRVKTVRHQHVIRMKHENLPILNKVYITVYIISCSKPALMFFSILNYRSNIYLRMHKEQYTFIPNSHALSVLHKAL